MKARTAILVGFGINADREMARAFKRAGSDVDLVHVEDLRRGQQRIDDYNILAFPGGFSFGDHLGSGKVLSHMLKKSIGKQIKDLHARGGLILGVCNGFQTLAKMGLVPDTMGDWTQEVSLISNANGSFLDQWVELDVHATCQSPWLKGIRRLRMPMRHGEGRMVLANEELAQTMLSKGLVALTYSGGAPNGSWHDVAGICDTTGRILGMMPHPECFQFDGQDPAGTGAKNKDGMGLFVNAVRFVSDL